MAKEVSDAIRLKKIIIPCKHTDVNWSDSKRLGLDSVEYIEFDNQYDLIRGLRKEIRKYLPPEFSVILESFKQKDIVRHEIRTKTTSTARRWLAREIKRRLADASQLERWSALDPSGIAAWLLETQSFVEESFGTNSQYYRHFPKFRAPTASALMGGLSSARVQFNEAKEQLQDILQDMQEEE